MGPDGEMEEGGRVRLILRFSGEEAPRADVELIRQIPGLRVIEETGRMLLVFVSFKDRASLSAAEKKGLLPARLGRFTVKYVIRNRRG
ncbi:MAG: hypothetical protein HY748_11650 [Elusimicrobia bacterium]|nr:hypothetical protein [Elusimicrobiota bacterium]